jgi:2-polyprenyl-6-methoxyphenol hydroxylase-like FAD-dependent oxidoreductase
MTTAVLQSQVPVLAALPRASRCCARGGRSISTSRAIPSGFWALDLYLGKRPARAGNAWYIRPGGGRRRACQDPRAPRCRWRTVRHREYGVERAALSAAAQGTAHLAAGCNNRGWRRDQLRMPAVGAEPTGVLKFADGSSVKADLVIGADGINSRVRDSLDMLQWRKAGRAIRLSHHDPARAWGGRR